MLTNEESRNILAQLKPQTVKGDGKSEWHAKISEAINKAIEALSDEKHGEWILEYCGLGIMCRCSECKKYSEFMTKYCAECGTKMDKNSITKVKELKED